MFKVLRKDDHVEEDEYIQSLHLCKEVAQKESKRFAENLDLVKNFLSNCKHNLAKATALNEQVIEMKDDELTEHLQNLSKELINQLQVGHNEMSEALNKKIAAVSHFTITLFGRTKAGKSTIREALTNGDGSSIGQGEQRKTRDVVEYFWNNLRIIDTPGIAAFNGEDDVRIAESVIDESDLILFLVTSDSIQQSEFAKLEALRGQNKPVIVLLNVKEDIEQPLHMKRFLKNWSDTISMKGQQGHVDRISEFVKRSLGYSDIDIIPIHAKAAFLCTLEDDPELKKRLYTASQIEVVKSRLRQLVIGQGIQKRTQTFRDDYSYYLNSLESVFWQYYRNLDPRVKFLKNKHRQMVDWFDRFIPESNARIETEVHNLFANLYLEIDSFVDCYAGSKDAKRRWQTVVNSYQIQSKTEAIAQNLIKEVKEYLEEFSRQIYFEMENIDFGRSYVSNVNKGVLGRVARWGSAASGVALCVIGLNWWNPVGWVTAVITGAGLLLGIFGMIVDDDSKRYEKEKQKAKERLKAQVQTTEQKVTSSLKRWFYRDVTKGLKTKLKGEFVAQLDQWEYFTKALRAEAKELESFIDEENKDLYVTLIRQTFPTGRSEDVVKVVRQQGRIAKVLGREQGLLARQEVRSIMENIVGERIYFVPFISDPSELLSRAIYPARIMPEQVLFNPKLRKFVVSVPRELVGSLIGTELTNIRLTAKLLDAEIEVQPEKETLR